MKTFCLLAIITLSSLFTIASSQGCFKQVQNYWSNTLISDTSYQTLEQAKQSCLLQPGCQSISYMQLDNFNKVYQLRGYPLQQKNDQCLQTFLRTDCLLNNLLTNQGSFTGIPNLINNVISTQNNLSNTGSNSNSICSFNRRLNQRYAQIVELSKAYRTQIEAETACKINPICDGIMKINTQGQQLYDSLQSKCSYLYYLGKGQLQQDFSVQNNGIECYQKQNCQIQKQCQYQLKISSSCAGCVQNCRDFSTLEQAQDACDRDSDCQAITFSVKEAGSTASVGAAGNGYGYQLRGSNLPIQTVSIYENSWIKTECNLSNLQNNQIDYCKPTLISGSYFPGCIDGCRDYQTLDEAIQQCGKLTQCQGVTLSRSQLGGQSSNNPFNHVFGYQLRMGPALINSHQGENSWYKPNCLFNQNSQLQSLSFFNLQNLQSQNFQQQQQSGFQQNIQSNGLVQNNKMPQFSQNNFQNNGYQQTQFNGDQSDFIKQTFQQNLNFQLQNQQQQNLSNCFKQSNNFVFSKDSLAQSQIYHSYQDSVLACSQDSLCQGIQGTIDQTQFRLAYGHPFQYESGTSFIKNCNDQQLYPYNYPTFFSECNQQGQKLTITSDYNSIDMSMYKSAYIPSGYQIQYYPNENFQGSKQIISNSVQCKQNLFYQIQNSLNMIQNNRGSIKLVKVI